MADHNCLENNVWIDKFTENKIGNIAEIKSPERH